jgi:hypothetical protein
MRKWGIVITVFYVLVLVFLLLPATILLTSGDSFSTSNVAVGAAHDLESWLTWTLFAVVAGGEALLLFLSVDTSQKRLKPRTHLLTTAILAAAFLAVLTCAAVFSIVVAIRGDNSGVTQLELFGLLALLWVFWGVVFYTYCRDANTAVSRATAWLLRGSVLELLVAVPCHVIVRRRDDCSAPVATGFGIVTGIAIMLLSFGPSVLFLFKKRMDASDVRRRNAS